MPSWISKLFKYLSSCHCKFTCSFHLKCCHSDCFAERDIPHDFTIPPTPPPSPDVESLKNRAYKCKLAVV